MDGWKPFHEANSNSTPPKRPRVASSANFRNCVRGCTGPVLCRNPLLYALDRDRGVGTTATAITRDSWCLLFVIFVDTRCGQCLEHSERGEVQNKRQTVATSQDTGRTKEGKRPHKGTRVNSMRNAKPCNPFMTDERRLVEGKEST